MTSTQRIQIEPCYILHRRKFKESSYLVDLFTQNYGVVRAATRTISKHKKSLVQPFTPCHVSWTQKKELASLTHIEQRAVPFTLMGHALASAFYMNEITIKSLRINDDFSDLFAQYEQTLQQLTLEPTSIALPLRLYEKKLLETLGYGLPIHTVIDMQLPAEWYIFSTQEGFIPQHIPHSQAISHQTLVDFSHGKINTPQAHKEIKRLMQTALSVLLSNQPIQSRALVAT